MVLDLSLSTDSDIAIDLSTITFTNANWDVPRMVNVTGLNDDLVDGDEQTTITVAVNDAASDDAFDSLADQTVIVTTTDDDTAGFTLNSTTATVSEDGTTTVDSFTIVLTAKPASNVVLDLGLSENPDAAIDLDRITFDTNNWDQAKTVSVTGLNDDVDDGEEQTTVTISIDTAASDDVFDAVANQTVIVTTTDDDTAGFTLSKTEAVVSEDGVSTVDSFTVVLDSQPVSEVVLTLMLSDDPDASVNKNLLTFRPDDWDEAQTVNVSGLDDDFPDQNEQTTITISVDDGASDDSFDDLDDKTVTITTTDDDTAGFTLSKTTATVSEDGTSVVDSFNVVLSAQPLTDVVLDLSLSTDPEVAIDIATVTFTTTNWNEARTVNVVGLNDDLDDDNEQTTITVSVRDSPPTTASTTWMISM